MKMTEVKSSRIHSIGYDPEEMKMRVRFHKGGTYDYRPITKDGYMMLITAPSIGKIFELSIKNNPKITYEKISD